MAKDIALDDTDDLIIQAGDFLIQDSEIQELGLIMRFNQGELKSDPIMGCNLVQLLKSPFNRPLFRKRLKVQLKRDGKQYSAYKNAIHLQNL